MCEIVYSGDAADRSEMRFYLCLIIGVAHAFLICDQHA